MKLLLDENIFFRVLKSIRVQYPESASVTDPNLKLKSDYQIFEYAGNNDFVIVTFDEDFYDIQLIKGYPPKIIWSRFGNSSNIIVERKILDNQKLIDSFLLNPEVGILEIY